MMKIGNKKIPVSKLSLFVHDSTAKQLKYIQESQNLNELEALSSAIRFSYNMLKQNEMLDK